MAGWEIKLAFILFFVNVIWLMLAAIYLFFYDDNDWWN